MSHFTAGVITKEITRHESEHKFWGEERKIYVNREVDRLMLPFDEQTTTRISYI